jgi:4-alpha-glucanotransferase
MKQERSGGILLHPTSLPGDYGIGTLGRDAIKFIDFLAKARQKIWQILPLNPTGFADSPYQCFSSIAGNPLLIDPELLVAEGFLEADDPEPLTDLQEGRVNYGQVTRLKYPLLKKAFLGYQAKAGQNEKERYQRFLENNSYWLNDYAMFMALKEQFGQKPWYQWDEGLKMKAEDVLQPYYMVLQDKIEFQKFLQYLFFKQWMGVKDYAHQRSIRIIGDIPLYVAHDSADAWANPDIFQFDSKKDPVAVGGVPPDYFSLTGQLWGNPLYRWEKLAEDGYKWWINRIKDNLVLYDMIRIDHFRGLAAYWAVPYGEKTAINGKWIPCPGKSLLTALQKEFGELPIIAEDLGVITPDVVELRDSFGLPGMKILQFAFDSNEANDYLPYNYPKNCVVYTGTHDNDTVMGWYSGAKKEDKKLVMDYLHSDGKELHWDFIRLAWASVASLAITPAQDLLGLANDARMNLPGTTVNNWMWRLKSGQLTDDLAAKLAEMTVLYGRA